MPRTVIILLLLTAAVMAGCTRRDKVLDARVDALSALADVLPDSALHLLDSIAPEAAAAPEASRMRHALATVKARDKAYITHTSDSLIRPVLDYYSSRPSSDTLRPVAFYYAGRVYSDLGDTPRALDYFQQALDAIPADQNIGLRSIIHAQMGGLFYNQLMLDEAIAETKEGLRYDIIEQKPIKETQSLQSLGFYYLVLHKYDSAEFYYNSALERAKGAKLIDIERQILRQLAMNNLVQGRYEKAEELFKTSCPNLALREEISTAHSIGAHIAIAKGNEEEALPYLRWLCDSGTIQGKIYALKRLAFIKMTHANKDSALLYLSQSFSLEDSVNQNKDSERIAQIKSSYDYSIHERESSLLKAEKSTLKWQLAFIAILLISIIIIASWYIIRLRQQNRKFRELEKLYKNNENFSAAIRIQEEDISALPIVKTFKEKSESGIPVSDEEWSELEDLIRTHYPKLYLALKVNNVLSLVEWRVTMLIKIDIQPSKISNLINRSKNSVSSIRTRLNKKLNGGSGSSKDWDAFVRSL